MLDYHVHLWPHEDKATERELTVERLSEYCEEASKRGVREIALTEHLFRFRRGREIVEGFWADEPDEALREYMAAYFDHHATADLDLYMETVDQAKAAGLPVVAGLEVDYYPGRMDRVASLLDGYPFDVLLGSIHWLGTWMFDLIDSPVQQREWDSRGIEHAWRAYGQALEELAATRTTDVLAHPDLVKVAGRRPDSGVVREVETRIAEAAATSGMAAEISSAGLLKPAREAFPSKSLLQRFSDLAVPVTTASDTHGISRIALDVRHLHDAASMAGYVSLRAFSARVGYDVELGPLPPELSK